MSDVRVCAECVAPLVFTMEYAGAEYVCVECGNTEGIFGNRVPTSPARVARHSALTAQYERERAERQGRPVRPVLAVGDPGVKAPTCGGCGEQPPVGTVLDGDKPALWFSATTDGVTRFACKRGCIPERESVLPW